LSEVWIGLRILFLSGYAEGTTPIPPMAADRPMLAKPFRTQELVSAVQDALAAEEYRRQPQLQA